MAPTKSIFIAIQSVNIYGIADLLHLFVLANPVFYFFVIFISFHPFTSFFEKYLLLYYLLENSYTLFFLFMLHLCLSMRLDDPRILSESIQSPKAKLKWNLELMLFTLYEQKLNYTV